MARRLGQRKLHVLLLLEALQLPHLQMVLERLHIHLQRQKALKLE